MTNALPRPARPDHDAAPLRRATKAASELTTDALCDNVLRLCERLKAVHATDAK